MSDAGGSDGMRDWVAAACAELGLDPAQVSVPVVLDLARDVAHGVLRPAAPVAAYLLGVAVGRGAVPAQAAGRLSALAVAWPAGTSPSQAGPHPALADPPPA